MLYLFGHRHREQQKDASMQSRTRAGKRPRFSALTLCVLACGAIALIGCGGKGSGSGSSSGGGSGSSGGPAVDVTGNWQIQLTATNSPAPISSMAGYLSQQGTGSSQYTTASLQAQTSGCFEDASTVPMYGQTSGSDVNLSSFTIDGQVLSINVQANTAGSQFSGTYSIAGGCADGASGSVAGTEYAPVTGTYTGATTGSAPAVTMSLSLSQDAGATGMGTFPLSGSATFTGISCFSAGTLSAEDGSVIGDSVTMQFTTNGTDGSEIQMSGTINPAATTMTLSSIQITGGNCSGALGSATLTRQ